MKARMYKGKIYVRLNKEDQKAFNGKGHFVRLQYRNGLICISQTDKPKGEKQ